MLREADSGTQCTSGCDGQDHTVATAAAIPHRIFFDLGESYQFNLRISLQPGVTASSAWHPVSFQLNDGGAVELSIESQHKGGLLLPHTEYTVSLLDSGASSAGHATSGVSLGAAEIGKRAPGEDMTISSLQILYVRDDTGSADDGSTGGSKNCPVLRHAVTLLSGCPPGRRVEFDVAASRYVRRALNQQRVEVDHGCRAGTNGMTYDATPETAQQGNGTDAAAVQSGQDIVTCVWAGHDFYPVFRIVDDLSSSGKSDVYNGSFRLTIVAGGPSPTEMVDYTLEEQAAYSMWPPALDAEHSSPVYGFLQTEGITGDNPTGSGISWICSPGSPCSHVLPRFPNTPEIYFRFRFDTTFSDGTYCDYTTEFTLRLVSTHAIRLSAWLMPRNVV